MHATRKIIAAATLAAGLALGAGVAPAHAGTGTLRGVYYTQSECLRVGWYGHDNYGWGWPECLQQDQNGQPQTFWFLYA